MLTEKDRRRLARLLARARTAKSELAAAEQEATATSGLLKDAEHDIDWRDRLFAGSFSREPARADAYHNARRAHAGAAAEVNRRKRQLARRHRQLDRRVRPMMLRLDSGHGRFATAIRKCDRAYSECARMRQWIVRATVLARTASEKRGRDDKAAERARRQFPQLVAKVRNEASTLEQTLNSARHAVRGAGCRAQHLRWDTAPFDQLPHAAADFSAQRRPARTGQDPLQHLHQQLNHAIATIRIWREETKVAEANAVSAARDRLINESGP
jgi:hypothetical protein